MNGIIKADVIPKVARRFLRTNPTIRDIIGATDSPLPHTALIEYLNKYQHDVAYREQLILPNGGSPGLYVGLRGIPGTFLLLIDRYDEPGVYQAVRFIPSYRIDSNRDVIVEWFSRHVSGKLLENKAPLLPSF